MRKKKKTKIWHKVPNKESDVEVSDKELLSNYDEFVNKCKSKVYCFNEWCDGEFQKRFENCKMETQEL